MTEYYLWPSKANADAALANINANPAFPIVGRNAATEQADPANVTTCRFDATVQTLDGKWGFPRIPAEILDAWGVSEANRAAWLAAFVPEIVSNPVFPSSGGDE